MILGLGLQIVPTMSVGELLDTVVMAEELGFEFAMVADEGLMHDVYVALGAAAVRTSTIRLGVVTNPYTRHPAVTAAGLATINEVSDGRAFVTLVAGGTMVLNPMGIEREAPLARMADTLEILRLLWTGESVTWGGQRHRLENAQLSTGPHEISIWMAARGPKMLALAGGQADGVVLMVKSDLDHALGIVNQNGSPLSIYLDRLAYTPEMIEEAKGLYGYALMDSPQRLLESLGIDEPTIAALRRSMAEGGPTSVAPMITDEMVAAYQIAGTPEECRDDLAGLIDKHDFDLFFVNIISTGLEANERLLRDIVEFTKGSRGTS